MRAAAPNLTLSEEGEKLPLLLSEHGTVRRLARHMLDRAEPAEMVDETVARTCSSN